MAVSIPNGKPGPLRRPLLVSSIRPKCCFNPKREARPSQTWTTSRRRARFGPCFNPKREARPSQTQTPFVGGLSGKGFNPKREARPSQTCCSASTSWRPIQFQSQTGSQALSDREYPPDQSHMTQWVSIPNGKPGPLRRRETMVSRSAMAAFQSQTGSQALSDFLSWAVH